MEVPWSHPGVGEGANNPCSMKRGSLQTPTINAKAAGTHRGGNPWDCTNSAHPLNWHLPNTTFLKERAEQLRSNMVYPSLGTSAKSPWWYFWKLVTVLIDLRESAWISDLSWLLKGSIGQITSTINQGVSITSHGRLFHCLAGMLSRSFPVKFNMPLSLMHHFFFMQNFSS